MIIISYNDLKPTIVGIENVHCAREAPCIVTFTAERGMGMSMSGLLCAMMVAKAEARNAKNLNVPRDFSMAWLRVD